MTSIKFLLASFLSALIGNVCGQSAIDHRDFGNPLILRTAVKHQDDISSTIFSDLGAWHGYSLPSNAADYGSFTGPLVMDMNGRWLANTLFKVVLRERGESINLAGADKVLQTYYPGMLYQSFAIAGLEVQQELIFVSRRSALIRTTVINRDRKSRKLDISFVGNVLPDWTVRPRASGIVVTCQADKNQFTADFSKGGDVTVSDSGYTLLFGERRIKPGARVAFETLQSYCLDGDVIGVSDSLFHFDVHLAKNAIRWNGYLNAYFTKVPGLSTPLKRLAVKSIVTLITNWRSAAKDIRHDGVFPSVNYQGFYGVWSWDSWKQAVGLTLFAPSLARDNIRSMMDYMDASGMIADCIYTNKAENNWRDTKPPLASWAVWNIYHHTGDEDFVAELYDKLVRYHRWWYVARDHDQDGLCEYGSTDGTRVAAAWESGMDNAVRFDSAVMVKNNDHAWSLNQESVDLNAYLYADKIYLGKLAAVLGRAEEQARWKSEAAALATSIDHTFYDRDRGYYYDQRAGGKLVRVEGTEGWIPLWAGLASPQQAQAVSQVIDNPFKFNTKVPMPTFTADHPKFDPLDGYWRGPVWIDQFYFGVEGLRKYGKHELASALVKKLFDNAQGLTDNAPVCENYHPLTGACLNARNFSWSAAHLLMLLAPEQIH